MGVGMGVDADGNLAYDPSRNVLDLVEAANRRQDDLREAHEKYAKTQFKHLAEITALRARERENDIANVRDLERMRADHAREMRIAEAERIDAIRAVDVGAVQQAAATAALQATTLAAQVATSAETLRTQVQDAATAQTVALAAALSPIQTDVADLRKAQYEAQGQKTQVVEQRSGTQPWLIALATILVTILIAAASIATVVVTHSTTPTSTTITSPTLTTPR